MSVGRAGREELGEMEGGGEMEVLGRRGGVVGAVEVVEEEKEEDGEDVTTGGGAGEWFRGAVGFLGEIFGDFLFFFRFPPKENLSFEDGPSVSS